MTTLVTAKAISKQYAIPEPTVYYYAHKGIIPFYRIGGRLKFNPDKVEKIFKQGEATIARSW